jgi:glucose-1-phosphate adenylyltransferase
MFRKEMVAMLLAGGSKSCQGALTSTTAKPAVPFGGKYRIIDFALSNCVNSGIDTVGVLTQYHPLKLSTHIGIGIPWDLDKNFGGITVFPPHNDNTDGGCEGGNKNAVLQNLEYIETYNPDYVLLLSGDNVYKMDYEALLAFHKKNHADVTMAVMPVSETEADRLDIVKADADKRIVSFGRKPVGGEKSYVGMNISIFNKGILKEALLSIADTPGFDIWESVMLHCHEMKAAVYAYEFNGYFRDVSTVDSYLKANLELVDMVPEFNLYEDYWRIYTKAEIQPPQYVSADSRTKECIVGEGSDIYGKVYHSVIGCGVTVGEGSVVRNSVVMSGAVIGRNCELDNAIVAENAIVGDGDRLAEEGFVSLMLESGKTYVKAGEWL